MATEDEKNPKKEASDETGPQHGADKSSEIEPEDQQIASDELSEGVSEARQTLLATPEDEPDASWEFAWQEDAAETNEPVSSVSSTEPPIGLGEEEPHENTDQPFEAPEPEPATDTEDLTELQADNPLEPAALPQKKKKFNHNSFLGLLVHLSVMVVLSAVMIVGFFYVYLPISTYHGSEITVPNLKGLHLDSAKVLLEKMGLRLEVYDSSESNFTKDQAPLTVLDQDPPAEGKVKRNRVIYLTVNPVTPPMVEVPNVIASSVKNTQIRFKSLGLGIKIKYINGQYPNTVERLEFEGKELTKEILAKGFKVPKGSVIQLYVNSGAGNDQDVTVPNLVGMPFDEAEWMLIGMGLAIGKVTYVESDDMAPGTVVLQNPSPENRRNIKIGSTISVTLSKNKKEPEGNNQ